jgi:VanZ family protein
MTHRSTARPLAWAVAALVVYASLYPFAGWRWPPGVDGSALLVLPWPPWRDRFDEFSNFIGYVPLGALIYGAVVRSGGRRGQGWAAALGLALVLAYLVELAQQFLPSRVPSLKDCTFNIVGAAAGAALATALQALGLVDDWQRLRQRWFASDSATGLVILLLWPAALLFPAPVPLGLGHVWGELRQALLGLLAGTPWAEAALAWLGEAAPAAAPSRVREGAIIALGLLAPCLVAYALSHPGWHRLVLWLGALAIATGVTTLSTALNFGPSHALAWWTPPALAALVLASLAVAALTGIGRRLAAALGLLALGLLLALVAGISADPYYAASLQSWEQGRFIRFHGLAQWIGWLWPFAAMAWLLVRLGQRSAD